MKAIFSRNMLEIMMDIRFNNNKEFMQNNRDRYDKAMKQPYYQLIDLLTPTMLEIDPQMEVRPAKCLSRIFRDTRFSKSKLPYRDHHWIAFRRQAEPRDKAVMFWFEIRLEAVGWGLGFWGENLKAMDVLRRQMLAKPKEFEALLPILDERYFVLDGRMYQRKKVPESLPEVLHPWYLRREIYLVKQGINPDWVFEPGLENRLAKDFLALKPFYRMLKGAYDFANLEL